MHNYREQLETVKQIRIAEGEHKTLDCPFCGGQKKFTIDRLITGELLWNCFRASCNAKGKYSGERSIAGAKAYLASEDKPQRPKSSMPIPAMTTRIENTAIAYNYLRSVNSLEAYENALIKIRYAPREKRVLFYNQDQTGAVGRAMYCEGAKGPKWLSYGDTSGGIVVGRGNTAVVVEDAASACSIARINNTVGFSVLGTHIPITLKKHLQLYKFIYILLDNDAKHKAVSIQKQLRGNVYIRFTDKDPKEQTTDENLAMLRFNEPPAEPMTKHSTK